MKNFATVYARIDPKLKNQVDNILHNAGISTTEAIRMFYTKIQIDNEFPFKVEIPNASTIDAINELESGKGHQFNSINEVWNNLESA